MQQTCGIIFVGTGAPYIELALRAAESVKAVCPGLPVDLFADADVASGAIDRLVRLPESWARSKIDAMMATRFDRTLYLDADLFVMADIRDVFDVLDRFDMALAHEQARNTGGQVVWRERPPEAFAQPNSGVIAYRNSDPVQAFLRDWKQAVLDHGIGRDQPALRELLWKSELRVATLPEEYNLMHYELLRTWWTRRPAPRIMHSPRLHQHITDGGPRIDTVEQLVGPVIAARLPDLYAADRSLARVMRREAVPPASRLERRRRLLISFFRTARYRVRRWFWLRRLFREYRTGKRAQPVWKQVLADSRGQSTLPEGRCQEGAAR